MQALWKIIQALWKYISAFRKYTSALKIYKCPEFITGANLHFEAMKLCILDENYALCILLRKIPSSDDFANILELLYTF